MLNVLIFMFVFISGYIGNNRTQNYNLWIRDSNIFNNQFFY